jgi:hypothetical protein
MRPGEMRKTEEQFPAVLAGQIATYITGSKNHQVAFSRKSGRKSPRKSGRKSPRKSARKSTRKSTRKSRKSPRKARKSR